jgi:hypothetical protein
VGEDRIFVSELLLLAAWLGLPTYSVALAAQGGLLWWRGMGRKGLRLRLASALLGSAVLAYVLTLVLWIAASALPPRWTRESLFMPFGLFMMPAVLASAIACSMGAFIALRNARGSRTRG